MRRDIFRGCPAGEVAVIGLGKSGAAVTRLLAGDGHSVYASDSAGADSAGNSRPDLIAMGAEVQTGGHDLGRIRRAALVVASPGVPPSAPPLTEAQDAGVPVVSEIEIALHYLPSLRYVAVTGTNGKTTTTALVGHLLRALGHDAVDAGNIGTPLAELALMDKPPAWAALELSSFQLHDTPSVDPTVGVVTNLSPDHLDRYDSTDEYYADKARLFANARAESHWVLNGDDPLAMTLHERLAAHRGATAPGRAHTFSIQQSGVQAYFDRPADALMLDGELLLRRAELSLLGDHNVANALAAALAVVVADSGHRDASARCRMADALRSFSALPHRLEIVGEFAGVQWINDSKATNVSSAHVALAGMIRPFVLLLGGRHKGEQYTSLAEPFRQRGRVVLAFGESAEIIERDLGGLVRVERMRSDFGEVMRRARELAGPGDAVLLSPACSSFDMFRDYNERGAEFRRLALDGDS